ncbi:hypothetical protein SLEP1_g22709 [Rubroshorea leprosula]|uniref:Uncharacterized protein n=1 Tax=Rubroshorea leprosula TaxID=152421 RepID=A0AAV5JA13_9ROSI|nr:hypothetical protein SLEP1_g22709 [Rubroshorea leprosula]
MILFADTVYATVHISLMNSEISDNVETDKNNIMIRGDLNEVHFEFVIV